MNLQGNTAVEVEELSWLASLPTGWTTKALSRVFEMIGSGHTPPSDNPAYYDGNCLWVTTGELHEVGISETSKKITSDALKAFPALRIYPVGTLLIAMYGATIGRLGWLEAPAAVNQACCALARPASADARYVFYCFIAGQEALLLLSSGGGQPNVSQEKLRAFRIPQPPLPEQAYIASFLDRETGKIDALVAEQERLIALLKEKRQAVISQAVTKGLDLNVKMKDSGVEWLGEVPAHWEVRPLKYCASFVSGGTPSKDREDYWQGEVPWVSPKDMKQWVVSGEVDRISMEAVEAAGLTILPKSSVLIVVRGMILAHSFPVALSKGLVTINQDMKALLPKKGISPVFLARFLSANASLVAKWIDEAGHGTRALRMEGFAGFRIAVPPQEEQNEVAVHLGKTTTEIDNLVRDVEQSIVFLRERRGALISAAVTGKIDVRDQSAAEQEAA